MSGTQAVTAVPVPGGADADRATSGAGGLPAPRRFRRRPGKPPVEGAAAPLWVRIVLLLISASWVVPTLGLALASHGSL